MGHTPAPDRIVQLGLGFWGSKALLVAVQFEVFTRLSGASKTLEQLREELGLHPRSTHDFFDALVALGMLERSGESYQNTSETELFLVKGKPTYIGGMLEMANARLYSFWSALEEGLQTGQPQNEVKTGGDFFGELYSSPARLKEFLKAMTGLSLGSAHAIAEKFP